MSATQKHKTVTIHNGKFLWQRSVLGLPLRSKTHFETPEDAAIDSDLVAHYFLTTWRITLPLAMEKQEHWSCLIFSRRSVVLSDSHSVESALQQCVRDFVATHRAALEAHREAQPDEPAYSVLRRSEAYHRQPELQQWVAQCEVAEERGKAFAAINGEYLNSLLGSLSNRLTDCAGPVNRAVKMHERVSDPDLVTFREKLRELAVHIADTANYVEQLRREHEEKRVQVFSALQTLEANRPPLT